MIMQPAAGPIDPWKIEEVRKYLAKAFPGGRFDDYPRGGAAAHLFVVTESGGVQQHQKKHHLLVTRHFFERFADHAALGYTLHAEGVGKSLERAGERTVELY